MQILKKQKIALLKKIKTLLRILLILTKDPVLSGSLLKNFFVLTWIRIRLAKKSFIVIALTEHLGDIVAAEPVIPYLRTKFQPDFTIWVADKEYAGILQSHPSINKVIHVSCFSEWIILKRCLPVNAIYDLHINYKVCDRHHLVNVKPNPFDITFDNYLTRGNLLYAFSRSAGIEMPDTASPVLYMRSEFSDKLPGKYIVLHTSASDSGKMWKDECWNMLAGYVLDNFNDYTVIEIGLKKTITIANQRILDLTGKKKLPYIAGIIKNSDLFIGIDSAFAHFANALNKESLILLGTLNKFKNYMPYSGKFQKERDNIVVNHPDILHTMPCNKIFNLVQKKLTHPL